MRMSMLDELESYWERTDAVNGKKAMHADHIMMERHANEVMSGAHAATIEKSALGKGK